MTRCHCGRPLHYWDPTVQRYVENLIATSGENVRIETPRGAWLVQRHYIALHGIRAADLPKLGFPKAPIEGSGS